MVAVLQNNIKCMDILNTENTNILNNVIMRYKSSAATESVARALNNPATIATPLEGVQEYFKIECVENEALGEKDAIINDSFQSRTERLKQIKAEAERVCREAMLAYDKMTIKRKKDIENYEKHGFTKSKEDAEVDIEIYQKEKEYINTQYLEILSKSDADIYAAYIRGFEKGIIMKNKKV